MRSISKMRKYCIAYFLVSKILQFTISIAILLNLLSNREADEHTTSTQSPDALSEGM